MPGQWSIPPISRGWGYEILSECLGLPLVTGARGFELQGDRGCFPPSVGEGGDGAKNKEEEGETERRRVVVE